MRFIDLGNGNRAFEVDLNNPPSVEEMMRVFAEALGLKQEQGMEPEETDAEHLLRHYLEVPNNTPQTLIKLIEHQNAVIKNLDNLQDAIDSLKAFGGASAIRYKDAFGRDECSQGNAQFIESNFNLLMANLSEELMAFKSGVVHHLNIFKQVYELATNPKPAEKPKGFPGSGNGSFGPHRNN